MKTSLTKNIECMTCGKKLSVDAEMLSSSLGFELDHEVSCPNCGYHELSKKKVTYGTSK